jgi:para-aminobenzoate synthetase/4-amino-4-deoxychorismate lyase
MATALIAGEAPFLLFDDARGPGAGPARLYERPVATVTTREPGEVAACLGRLRQARADGLHAAGFLAYEAGLALEAKLAPLAGAPAADAPPLLWFGLFERCSEVAACEVPALLPDPAAAFAAPPRPLIARAAYEGAADRVKRHIEAGDVYQVNFTFAAEVATAGHPLALYAALRRRAGAGWGGIAYTGEHWLLSFSPELFFTLAGRQVTTRPMKGTAARRTDPAEDRNAAAALREDPKQLAENLMIVDLLRNDLSRVSKPGTVKAPALFAVETYPTVHQMTSTVTAELEDGVDAIGVLEAMFPCGSVTGAPKIRAMQLIADIEASPRGAYTGSIGWLAPDGDAAFNVAIRTLTMRAGEARAMMGLGSGIVADSRVGEEWRECLAKGAFVAGEGRFDLVETMRFDPHEGVVDLERHLARMKRSADELGFAFDRHETRNELQAATFRVRAESKLRLLLSRSGAVAVEIRPLPETPPEPVEVAVVRLPVSPDDFRLRHKTSDRSFYDEAREAAGRFEILFEGPDGCLTEGSFTSLFVERGGRLVTPPLARGLMPGVLRDRLLASGEAEEGDIVHSDLLGGFLIGNSLRGLIRAVVA